MADVTRTDEGSGKEVSRPSISTPPMESDTQSDETSGTKHNVSGETSDEKSGKPSDEKRNVSDEPLGESSGEKLGEPSGEKRNVSDEPLGETSGVKFAEQPVTLSAQSLERILTRGDGDAALLYLAVLRGRGRVPPDELAHTLHWSEERFTAAETVLRELELLRPKLVSPTASETVRMESVEERPVYQQADITAQLESNETFRSLTGAVEQKLGKKLSLKDLNMLLGLYDYAGLPPHVIYQLVCHCETRSAAKYGPGRHPTMRQIESEGYAWARMGVDTQEAAAEYLRRYAVRMGRFADYMRVLRLGERTPVTLEEKYLKAWDEWDFPPETVALAYDRTVLHCHEFRWGYCNGILRRWHEAGYHTPVEIETGDHGPRRTSSGPVSTPSAPDSDAEMKAEIRKYMQRRKKKKAADPSDRTGGPV